MMFVHNLVNSDENRIAKTILIEQSKENKINYYNEVKAVTDELGITMDIETLTKITKSEWKTLTKEKIKEKILLDTEKEVQSKTKMRFIKKNKLNAEEYITKLGVKEVSTIMRLKLNMVETKANFPKDDRICIMCKEREETSEHLFSCPVYQKLTNHNLTWSDQGKHWEDLHWLREAARVVERMEDIREREVNRQKLSI